MRLHILCYKTFKYLALLSIFISVRPAVADSVYRQAIFFPNILLNVFFLDRKIRKKIKDPVEPQVS